MSENSFGGYEYSTLERWTEIVPPAILLALGVVLLALGTIVGRLDR